MAYDIYSSATLNGVVDRLIPVPTLFLDTFFPSVLTHESEEVYFDRLTDKPRITPFVHPLHEGKVIDSLGYTTNSVKPAYLKDLRIHNPNKALKRRAGEALTAPLTPAARLAANIAADLADQQRMFRRRMEVMAIEAIARGRQTIIGEGFNAVVDFGRDAALSITLAGAAKWDAGATVDSPSQFEDWSQLIADRDGSTEIVVMGVGAYRFLKTHTKALDLLNTERRGSNTNFLIEPRLAIEVGAQYKGMLGEFPLYTYSGSYIDPADGQTKKYIADNEVILAGRRVEGVRHFGAIMDVDVLIARESYSQSWTERNPSRRMLMTESAPLMVPYRPNSSLRVVVY